MQTNMWPAHVWSPHSVRLTPARVREGGEPGYFQRFLSEHNPVLIPHSVPLLLLSNQNNPPRNAKHMPRVRTRPLADVRSR